MTNPYESPKSPFQPTEPPLTARTFGMFVAGFLATMAMTFAGTVVSLTMGVMLVAGLPDALQGIVIFLCSPAIVGPVCSIVLWRLTRVRNRPFAVGAVACGVAAFLLFGTCFLAIATFN